MAKDFCYHDPDSACFQCRYYEQRIADLKDSAWRRNSIARVLVVEGDQFSGVRRVAQILSVQPTDMGLIITVR